MDLFDILAMILTLTAVFSYLNYRVIGLPITIGVMLIALVLSLLLHLVDQLGLSLKAQAEQWLSSIDFNKAFLHGMLSFLLFAGALHINLNELIEKKWVIGSLAVAGTLLSTAILGILTWWSLAWVFNFVWVLSPVRSVNFSHRSHCCAGNPEACRCSKKSGDYHSGRIVV